MSTELAARGTVVLIAAIKPVVAYRQAAVQRIGERPAQVQGTAPCAVGSGRRRYPAFERRGRPPAYEIDRSSETVAAIQGALRALDDLNALDVEQIEIETGPARHVDAVEENLDVVDVTEEVVLGQTANGSVQIRSLERQVKTEGSFDPASYLKTHLKGVK